MSILSKSMGVLVTGLLFVHASGFAQTALPIAAGKVGPIVNDQSAVPIGDLFDDPATFDKQHVRIMGKVGNQDPGGHWLYLEDKTARIYVDTPLAIPRLEGKTVTIYGTVDVKHGIPSIVAREVR